jgi:hypothetical protein
MIFNIAGVKIKRLCILNPEGFRCRYRDEVIGEDEIEDSGLHA